jgi:Flp pilus assembly pilin Flp
MSVIHEGGDHIGVFIMLQFLLVWVRSRLPKLENGQGLVEYALILILVAIACFIVLVALGNAINSGLYNNSMTNF